MEQATFDNNQVPKTTPETSKAPYHSPILVEYGNVAKLTQGGSVGGGDGSSSMMMAVAP